MCLWSAPSSSANRNVRKAQNRKLWRACSSVGTCFRRPKCAVTHRNSTQVSRPLLFRAVKEMAAIQAGHMFDGERLLGLTTVLIEDGQIVDVDTSGSQPPEGA